jgi:hypothetical protein
MKSVSQSVSQAVYIAPNAVTNFQNLRGRTTTVLLHIGTVRCVLPVILHNTLNVLTPCEPSMKSVTVVFCCVHPDE